MRNRRNRKAWKLREYVSALQEAQACSDERWCELYAAHDLVFRTRAEFIGYLERCIVEESTKLYGVSINLRTA